MEISTHVVVAKNVNKQQRNVQDDYIIKFAFYSSK